MSNSDSDDTQRNGIAVHDQGVVGGGGICLVRKCLVIQFCNGFCFQKGCSIFCVACEA